MNHDRSLSDMAQIAVEWAALRPFGGFNMVMVDPPWPTKMRSEKGHGKSPEAHYQTMAMADIKALPVEALAAQDCLLWLWARGAMLGEAMACASAWGFEVKTCGWWAKMTPRGKQCFGLGYVLRDAGEPFLIASRGEPKTSRAVRNTILGLRRAHSQKPEEAYREAERLMPDARRIEVFSRMNRPGWRVWGDQTGTLEAAA